MEEFYTKEDAQNAIKRLVNFFLNYKGGFFGLDDLSIIDFYIENH